MRISRPTLSCLRSLPRPRARARAAFRKQHRRARPRATRSPIRSISSSAGSMADADLGVLQGWMLSAVTAPGGVAEGVRIGRERYELDVGDPVRSSNRLSAEQRLDIY